MNIKPAWTYFIGIILIVMTIGLLYSRAMMSISMILMSAAAIVYQVKYKPNFNSKTFLPFGALMLVFVGIFVSGINSEDLNFWVKHMRLKLPFMLLPAAFYVFKKQVKEVSPIVFGSFLAMMTFSTIPILSQLFDSEILVQQIAKGQAVDTPIDHIKYSLFLAFSIFIGIDFWINSHKKWKHLLLILSIYLIVILHFLAVRSGLAVFYISSIVLIFWYGLRSMKKTLLLALIPIFLLPIVAFNTIPSFKKKAQYMLYDFQMYQKGEGAKYSDSERIYSIQVGLEIFKSAPILGSGIGDLKQACKDQYQLLFEVEGEKYPHNQIIYYLAGSGIVGLLFFLLGMYFPMFYFRKELTMLFIALMLILSLSFVVENTIERAHSIAFVLLFMLTLMCNYTADYFNASKPQSR